MRGLLLAVVAGSVASYTLEHTVLKSSFPRAVPFKSPSTPAAPVFKRSVDAQALVQPIVAAVRAKAPLAFAVPVSAMLAFAAPGMIWSRTRIVVTLISAIGLIGGRLVYNTVCKGQEEECPVPPAPWHQSFTDLAAATAGAAAEASAATINAIGTMAEKNNGPPDTVFEA